ncbi:MAG TPA: hypothetical protein VI298_12690 [Geobacteraceae bacterium]
MKILESLVVGVIISVFLCTNAFCLTFPEKETEELPNAEVPVNKAPMIVSVNGNGAPDTVLDSADADITCFKKIDGYTEDHTAILNSNTTNQTN